MRRSAAGIKGKKGFEPLTGIIISSIFVVIVIAASVKIGKVLAASSDYTVCEQSYMLNFATSYLSKNNFKPQTTLLCYTQEIEISSKGIKQGSMRTKPIEIDGREFDDSDNAYTMRKKIGEEITEEMYLTMKEFVWGSYCIFSKWDEGIIFSGGEKSRCFRAATFTFTDDFWNVWNRKASAEEQNKLKGVGDMNTYARHEVEGQNETYWEYISQYFGGQEVYDSFPRDLTAGKKYEIIYRVVYNTGFFSGAYNLLVGDSTWYYKGEFRLIEESQEQEYCNRWA